jgi:hypothetical protein
MVWTRDWLESNPVDHTQFQDQPGHVRAHKVDISDRLKDLIYGFTSGETETDEGFKKVPLVVQGSNPTNEANKVILFTKDVDSKAAIFAIDEDGNVFQITGPGALLIPNDAWLLGRNNAGAANVNLFKINTSDVLVLMDGSRLASSADPTAATDIPHKQYVDERGIKGWVNFDGTAGTIAPADSFNVDSLTDGGAGLYTVNWDTDFATANYAVSAMAGTSGDYVNISSIAAGSVGIAVRNDGGTPEDQAIVCVMAIGDQ